MHKKGVLHPGSPSVVSGQPSEGVVKSGEAVREEEKAPQDLKALARKISVEPEPTDA